MDDCLFVRKDNFKSIKAPLTINHCSFVDSRNESIFFLRYDKTIKRMTSTLSTRLRCSEMSTTSFFFFLDQRSLVSVDASRIWSDERKVGPATTLQGRIAASTAAFQSDRHRFPWPNVSEPRCGFKHNERSECSW